MEKNRVPTNAGAKRSKAVAKKPRKPGGDRPAKTSGPRLYTLEVVLTSGPVREEFLMVNPTISRTIQIRGDQTLIDLHHAINSSFDRDDDHLYGFFIPEGEGKYGGKELTLGVLVSSLNLRAGRVLRYHFDFGDDWIHDVKVTAVDKPDPDETYPRVTETVGKSPPQYPNMEQEDLDEDEDDEDWDEEEELTEGAAADVSLLIGEMHLKEGEFAKAVEAFTRAIESNPKAADEYEGRARAYQALAAEDERKARELRVEAARLETKHPRAKS
jgi:Plasmid pRiA4b ORF-3-like protein